MPHSIGISLRLVNQKQLHRTMKKLKKAVQFCLNPRFLLCFCIAWLITNGWSYILLGIGTVFQIGWMIAVASAYLAFIWFPCTPEKIITIGIAIALLRRLFPKDQHTLGVLKDLLKKADNEHSKKSLLLALSDFKCSQDSDIETFLHTKAKDFLERGLCSVYLIKQRG